MEEDTKRIIKRLKEQIKWWEEYKADALEVKQTIDAKLCFSKYKVKTYAPGKFHFALMCDEQIRLRLEGVRRVKKKGG